MESQNIESRTMPETQTKFESENNNVTLGAISPEDAAAINNINISQSETDNSKLKNSISKTSTQVTAEQNTQTLNSARETKPEEGNAQTESLNVQDTATFTSSAVIAKEGTLNEAKHVTNVTLPLTVETSSKTYVTSVSVDSMTSPAPSACSSNSVSCSPLSSPRSSVPSPSVTSQAEKMKGNRRGSAWNDDQTEFLMEIWARNTEQTKGGEELNHGAPIYRLISKKLRENDIDKSWEQCKTRIHTLKRAYKLTKDEVNAGTTSITYCRHYDKLKIISGDDPSITAKVLADILEAKRFEKLANAKNLNAQPKKRQNMINRSKKRKPSVDKSNDNIAQNPPPTFNALSINAASINQPVSTNVNSYWNNQTPLPQQQYNQVPQQQPQLQSFPATQQQQLGQQQIPHITLNYPYQTPAAPYNPTIANIQPILAPPPYPNTFTNDHTAQLPVVMSQEVNNNEIVVKPEKMDTFQTTQPLAPTTSLSWNTNTSASHKSNQSREDLEKLRLDLELRKVEVERNKIEMEERQRREERDHQYRMMQLLLFGLGQQNTAQLLTSQGAEQDVAQAHNGTLSRALENGLVPGGSHTANEKGLSFNEI